MGAHVGFGMRLIALVFALLSGLAFGQSSGQCYPTYSGLLLQPREGCGEHSSVSAAADACGQFIPTVVNGGSCVRENFSVGAFTQVAPNRWTVQYTFTWRNPGGNPDACSGESKGATAEITGVGTPTTCPEGTCTPGETTTENFTLGWSRTGAGDPYYNSEDASAWDVAVGVGAALIGSSACDGQCVISVGQPSQVWHAYTPAGNGLYRLSADYSVSKTGAQCSSITSNMDPNAAPPACDGAQGTINGKPVCVKQGATDQTVTSDQLVKVGNPAAGSDGSQPIGNRIPANGDGGNGGGPSSGRDGEVRGGAETGGNGGGEGAEINVETCGLPGKPPCKLDEAGTRTADGAYTGANGRLDDAAGDREESIADAAEHQAALPWVWGFSLPTGVCETFEWPPGETFDVCGKRVVHLWRDLLAYAVYVMGALYMWRTAVGNVGGGGK